MKIKYIEEITNDNIIRLSEILNRDKEILFQIKEKLIHIQEEDNSSFSINIFNPEDKEIMKDKLDFGFIINSGFLTNKTSIEAIVLSLNLKE